MKFILLGMALTPVLLAVLMLWIGLAVGMLIGFGEFSFAESFHVWMAISILAAPVIGPGIGMAIEDLR